VTLSRRSGALLIGLVTCLPLVGLTATADAAERTATAKPTYAIGFEGPLSGANAQFGIVQANAARLAVKQANARGTLPFNLTFVLADDQGDPSRAGAAATALISDQHVLAVVGLSFSGATAATGARYANARLGTVSPSATNPTLSGNRWPTFHRVTATDQLEGQLTAAWLHRRHVHQLAVVWDRSDYGNVTATAVTRRARALHIAVRRYTSSSTGHYGTVAASIAAHRPDAVYFGGYDTEAAKLARALTSRHYTGVKVGGNGMLSSVFTNRAGSAGYGWYATCGCMTSYVTTAQKAFAAAYRHTYNSNPGASSASAYDATNTIIRAIASAVAGSHHSRYWVNVAIGKIRFSGISTRVQFTAHGDLDPTVARVNLFRDGRGHFVQYGNIRTAA